MAGYSFTTVKSVSKWTPYTVKVAPVSRRELILGAMPGRYDEVSEATVYRHAGSPETVDGGNELYAYCITQKGKAPALRLRIQYVADEWLFINKFTLKIDDETSVLEARDMKRDNGNFLIWEWYDEAATPEFIKKLATSNRVVLRSHGSEYTKDRELTPGEQMRLLEVLAGYEILTEAAGVSP